MLGNWSFGNYYKREAIGWAWELLTRVVGLPKERLWVTIYRTDDEAEQVWRTVTDVDPTHILRFGEKDNFWEMGETGPLRPLHGDSFRPHAQRLPPAPGQRRHARGDRDLEPRVHPAQPAPGRQPGRPAGEARRYGQWAWSGSRRSSRASPLTTTPISSCR